MSGRDTDCLCLVFLANERKWPCFLQAGATQEVGTENVNISGKRQEGNRRRTVALMCVVQALVYAMLVKVTEEGHVLVCEQDGVI